MERKTEFAATLIELLTEGQKKTLLHYMLKIQITYIMMNLLKLI